MSTRIRWYLETWWPTKPEKEYKDCVKDCNEYNWISIHENRMMELFGVGKHPVDIADELRRPVEQVFERLRLMHVRDRWVHEDFKLQNFNVDLPEEFIAHLVCDDWLMYSRYIPLQGMWFKWRMIWLDVLRSQILPEMMEGVRLNRVCDFMPRISGKPVFRRPMLPHSIRRDPEKAFFQSYPKRVSKCKGVLTLVNKKVVGGKLTDPDERSKSEFAKISAEQMEVKLKEFAKRFLKKVKKGPSSFYRSSDIPIKGYEQSALHGVVEVVFSEEQKQFLKEKQQFDELQELDRILQRSLPEICELEDTFALSDLQKLEEIDKTLQDVVALEQLTQADDETVIEDEDMGYMHLLLDSDISACPEQFAKQQ